MVQGGEALTNVPYIADDSLFAASTDAGKPRKLSEEEKEWRESAKASFEEWLKESGLSRRADLGKSSCDEK